MEKSHIKKIAKAYGCTTRYSGRHQKMYIHGERSEEVVEAARFHNCRFDVIKTPMWWISNS